MFPQLEIFGRDIGLYSILVLCGIFAAGINACILARRRKYNYVDIIIFILFLFIGIIIGGHLLYALVNYKNVIYVFKNIHKINTLDKIISAFNYTIGGNIFYGGLIGGIITGFILTKKRHKHILFVDIIAVSIPLFHFFGRIGCFFGGCCYGVPSKIGLMYTNNPILEANGVERFPVQLLEALFNAMLFFLLHHFLVNKKFKYKLIFFYLGLYSIGRFFIEFLRGDTFRGIWLLLSTSQIISILILIFVLTRIKYVFGTENALNNKPSA
jgi:phosphatidylglycerol:prolipoprotein diacylglycerol transferase